MKVTNLWLIPASPGLADTSHECLTPKKHLVSCAVRSQVSEDWVLLTFVSWIPNESLKHTSILSIKPSIFAILLVQRSNPCHNVPTFGSEFSRLQLQSGSHPDLNFVPVHFTPFRLHPGHSKQILGKLGAALGAVYTTRPSSITLE